MILELTGGTALAADRAKVWAALHDVDLLRPCVPGCLSLARVAADRFALSVLVPLGPVSMAFAGHINIQESVPSRTLVLRARGEGGLAGLAAGTARLTLADVGQGCRLDYAIEAEPSGPFAIAGTLLLSRLARTLVAEFIHRFAARVEAAPANLANHDGRACSRSIPMMSISE